MSHRSKKVLVLAGGDSAERDVSIDSARGMADAARDAGFRVLVADPARPDIAPSEDGAAVFGDTGIAETPPELIDDIYGGRLGFMKTLAGYHKYDIDLVLNGLHGGAGEDGTVQAVLDYAGIPYTGSGMEACAVAMDKQLSKHLARSVGVPVAQSVCIERAVYLADPSAAAKAVEDAGIPFPVVVKPNSQGSSVGLTVVDSPSGVAEAAQRAFRVDDRILVEQFIAGRELTAAILEGSDLPLLEIRPKSGLYDYFHKYQHGATEYLVPAPLDETVAAAVAQSAKRAFDIFGCRVYGRVDFRLDENGSHYFLEVNTLPGMTSTSLVPKAAKKAGISYTELVERILRLSLAK
jgi:D-alanine-D-alanine ligase